METKNKTDIDALKEAFQEFLNTNKKVSKQELITIIKEIKTDELPTELFKTKKLSNLEAIVKYLRENQELTYKEIAKKLNRNPMTLAVTYKNAKLKHPKKIKITEHETIPYTAFKKNLSILEGAALWLKFKGCKQIQIAKMLGKDPRTIWTIISRAEKKIKPIIKKKKQRFF